MGGIVFLVVLGTTIWVGVDASNLGVKRGRLGGGGLDMSVASWVVCCLLLWIVAFPCYLIARGRYTSMNALGVQQRQYGYAQPGVGPVGHAQHPQPFAPAPQFVQPVQSPPFSPDGRWWWNGQQWVPVQPAYSAPPQ